MTLEHFEESLRQFIRRECGHRYHRREPFQAFVVEMENGRVFEVTHPGVAFGGGAASYITPGYDIVEFACEDVRSIRQATQEAAF